MLYKTMKHIHAYSITNSTKSPVRHCHLEPAAAVAGYEKKNLALDDTKRETLSRRAPGP
jgi:hypothetical protein